MIRGFRTRLRGTCASKVAGRDERRVDNVRTTGRPYDLLTQRVHSANI